MGNDNHESSTPPNNNTTTNIFLQIVEHLDGTITRPFIPFISPNNLTEEENSALRFRDIPLSPSSNTSLRLYLPSSPQKLPIILFFHGGGFLLFRSASAIYHFSCHQMAQSLPALIISVDYRLAPDHRLPAAYDDALDAILWLRAQSADHDSSLRDPWLASHADFNRVFLAGSSSGANIAFHAAIRISDLDLQPIKIAGVVLNQPYFGGEKRTKSEEESEHDVMIPLQANDMMWRLALPLGADRDHEYCNPVTAMAVERISKMSAKCLITCRRGDPLIDRQRQLVKVMEAAGVTVVARLEDEGVHAIELFDPTAAQRFFDHLKEFVY